MEEKFYDELNERKIKLSEKSDDDLLNIAVKCGQKLNGVTEYFPAYDVALKLLNNKWIPTEKQRKAIINVIAFYQTKNPLLGMEVIYES